jgi:hypothetical protein
MAADQGMALMITTVNSLLARLGRFWQRLSTWLAIRFTAVPPADTHARMLREKLLDLIWSSDMDPVTEEKLRQEFNSYLLANANAKSKEAAAEVAANELQNTTDEQTAIVDQARIAADNVIAAKQALKDSADAEALQAREKANAQLFYFSGLLGVTPPVLEDPTPEEE